MTTPAMDADGTKKVPEELPSCEKKQGMETPSEMTTPATDEDGTEKVLEVLPSREKKQGMETPSKMTTPAADTDADGIEKVPEALPSREKKQGMETPSKMTTPAADADDTQKVPQALLSLVKELGMEEYYPCKLSLQILRTLDIPPEHANEGPPTKQDLARSILKELMLTNTQCREEVIINFSKLAKPKIQKKAFGKPLVGKNERTCRKSEVPHPMDVLQVLFVCSDFAVRQILTRKLFLCRLAIPFILPYTYTHQLLLWPLRSIVLEWNDQDEGKEEALLQSKVHMVAFMRFGKNSFSKSNLLNQVLSESGHATFFHRGSPCGGEKRVTSDGMVEMSHFLPSAKQKKKDDIFKQPALFFNLRGDACSHDVPRQVLLKLSTVLVLVLDISQLDQTKVQDMLKETVAQKRKRTVLVLTDNDRHSQSEIDDINAHFCELLADYIEEIDIVETFNEQENANSLIQEVREAVSNKMTERPSVSLEEHVTSQLPECCEVDEKNNKHCSKGKELAKSILEDLSKVAYDKVKEEFLPMQVKCLNDLSKALRNLNRTLKNDEDTGNMRAKKQAIQEEIDSIREEQRTVSGQQNFTTKLIAMFDEDCETREFAIRWVQLRLDELSRQHLPGMHKEKNICWKKYTEARCKGDLTTSELAQELQRLQKKIDSATCGWEHLMRELGQMYEATLSHRKSPESSSLPQVVGQQLLDGQPVELMDGDHGIVPISWIKAVFQSLAKLVGNKKILVLSIIGIQSSGKSTLLNTMFGLEFAVSAGRCTRGIYAQLLPVRDSNLRFQYLLVLDTEGLRSTQRDAKYQYDNELATLVIGLSDIAMINLKGENITEMTDVLEIVVHAFLRMKLADSPQKRQCMFVHQNVAAVNAQEKLADDRQRLQERLDVMTEQASEALGLKEAITSFNQIISFDSQQDVVYFPDLWSGSPPMAAINQEYSSQACTTQRTILQRFTRHFHSFITMEDFVVRTEDIWDGVLSEDFIFSFRNTLAAKAYIDVEKEMARLTLAVEQEIREWVNSDCEPKIRSCNTEQKLDNHWTNIEIDLPKKINTSMEDKVCKLRDFFENHNASDVIEQWKAEKIKLLQTFGESLKQKICTSLSNSKARKLMQLRTKTDVPARQAEIQIKALDLAEMLRGKQHDPAMIDKQFDELWRNWATELTSGCTHVETKMEDAIYSVLVERFTTDERQFLFRQLVLTKLVPHSNAVFKIKDITAEHIKEKKETKGITAEHIKEKKGLLQRAKEMVTGGPTERDGMQMALEIANYIMSRIEQKITDVSEEEAATNTAMHGKEVLDEVWRAVEEHNKLPYEQAEFALTPQFKAMVAVRAGGLVMERFEAKKVRYEEQHGVRAQLAEYRQRIFGLFKNEMKKASDEIKAAEYVCDALKTEVEKQTSKSVRRILREKICDIVGTAKRDLMVSILDEIADMEDFYSLHTYVRDPSQYARGWLMRYVKNHLFNGSHTNYSKYASDECGRIVSAIESSIAKARGHITKTGSKTYENWREEFCRQIKNTMYINPSQLQIDGKMLVQDLAQFQKVLTSRVKEIHRELQLEFCKTKKVEWLESQSRQIFKDWWGCEAHCPFCKEPCIRQFHNHQGPHKCIQHKPQGLRGSHCERSVWNWFFYSFYNDDLIVDSCDFSVSTRSTFHCSGTGCAHNKNQWHPYADYKTFFPKWDISPNPPGDGGKYWKWAMATFHQELENCYPRNTLQVPDQWKKIKVRDAKESLRKW